MSEHAPVAAPAAAPVAHANPEAVTTFKGILETRWNALKGGTGDLLRTGWDTAKEYATVERSKGSPSIWGIMKNTARNVRDTLSWNSERGLLNFKNTSLNPFSKEKTFSLNPMVAIRRIAAGTTLAVSNVMSGMVGLGSDRMGNALEGGIKAVSRAVGGVIAGDYGGYLNSAAPTPKPVPASEPVPAH